MKRISLILTFLVTLSCFSFANGICIINAGEEVYLPLLSTEILVEVNNQIATVISRHVFRNNTGQDTTLKFGFPMTETGSALSLRWLNFGQWYTADLSPEPQDTLLPNGNGGGGVFPSSAARTYLGAFPLYFDLEQFVPKDSTITFEVTYVDLLPYAFNYVNFFHANDYSIIQDEPLLQQRLSFSLYSDRTIESVELLNHSGYEVDILGNTATLDFVLQNTPADADFEISYQLNADELGLFDFSTYIADSLLHCDDYGQGYMAFIIEPDPSNNTQVIDKVFTLIIDESGSMSGEKIIQAREAASFIVNNLNVGDAFNIISFDTNVTAFQPEHVPATAVNLSNALAFIDGINANGSTNISGAFSEAIEDFQDNDTEKANIIIFFTDGNASAGITSTSGILSHVQNELSMNSVQDLAIFTFGIGTDVNQQLLTLLATQNDGLVEFLENDELQEVLSQFYLTIQNPVLLNTTMTIDPPIITETYPQDLPNLFKGQQLIVVGRYQEPVPIELTFTGTAFGQPVEYNYSINLADTSSQALTFLPRLWAKRKMEHLFNEFYSLPPDSPDAMVLEDSTISISLCFGVISPFTSFDDNTNGGGGGATETTEISSDTNNNLILYPNPFRIGTTLQFETNETITEPIFIQIVNMAGTVIRSLEIAPLPNNRFEFKWDGLDAMGNEVPADVYIVKAIINGKVWIGKVVKI